MLLDTDNFSEGVPGLQAVLVGSLSGEFDRSPYYVVHTADETQVGTVSAVCTRRIYPFQSCR